MKDTDYLISWDKKNLKVNYTEILILGSGVAGLFTAIKLSDNYEVTILTKKNIMESNTEHAQGGIAVALSQDDSPESHFEDTLKAGAGLCNLKAVKILVEKGPDCVRELMEMGTQFDRQDSQLDFTREAAHSKKRVLHAKGDATGKEIERALVATAQRCSIRVKENAYVIDFLKNYEDEIAGVLVLDSQTCKLEAWLAKAVVLATGGLGQLYKYTTNPDVTTGDGIAAAYRAGAELMDMEFIQFHPTALLLPGSPSFLISEAARGEGAKLLNSRRERFMKNIPGQELAPRDVVARAIWKEMQDGSVFLDFGFLGSEAKKRFPLIYKTCLQYGIDISTTPVPIGPAAHYLMGGVAINTVGETSLSRLYACGECACNGVHGANRLASNSLLEGLVFASAITEKLQAGITGFDRWDDIKPFVMPTEVREREFSDVNYIRMELRNLMWNKVGIIRDREGLLEVQKELSKLWREFVPGPRIDELELGNMLTLSLIIVKAALNREESRGGHFRRDFPLTDHQWQKHSVQKRGKEHVSYVSI
jgi:L-aspartate oxidase